MMSSGFWKPESYVAGTGVVPPRNVLQQRMLLPISKHKTQIIYAVEQYSIVIIVGETGSGKSTQIPQYLMEYGGWTKNDFQIVCTQPRRIAATSLAQRVAQEVAMNTTANYNNNSVVGYTVRFDDICTPYTQIKYVTDGILLREATVSDPLLSKYSVILIDEAHERNLNTDTLLGLLKKIRRKRSDLRIIICSATIDAEVFLNYFIGNTNHATTNDSSDKNSNTKNDNTNNNNETDTSIIEANDQPTAQSRKRRRQRLWGSSDNNNNTQHDDDNMTANKKSSTILDRGTIISVDGRQYPVDVLHLSKPASDYVEKMIDVSYQIHHAMGDDGDILCFLPTSEQIDSAIRLAEERFFHSDTSDSRYNNKGNKKAKTNKVAEIDFLPLYGNLPYYMQNRIFEQQEQQRGNTQRRRRIIFATNIAETSITVPNVKHVIDSGLVNLPYYDPMTGLDRLIVCPISHASARQRTGRAGRTDAGKCYRLYTEQYMLQQMPPHTPPEILRTNLTSFLLTIKALGVDNILTFDLIDIPSIDAISNGLETLYALGAIDDTINLTQSGIDMSQFPTEPRISRMILESITERCTWEVLAVASAYQVRDLFHKPRSSGGSSNIRQQQAMIDYENAISDIADTSGDHVTYSNLFSEMDDHCYNEKECKERFINYVSIKRGIEIRNQLARFVKKFGRIQSIGLYIKHGSTITSNTRSTAIRRCVTAGFFGNIAKLNNDGRYYTIKKHIMVTPSTSSIFITHSSPGSISTEYIIFGETYDGSRGGIELKHVSSIEARWLRELAPNYFE